MYTDARLYISVSPPLEYQIPLLSEKVCSAFLGDISSAAVISLLESTLTKNANLPRRNREGAKDSPVERITSQACSTLSLLQDHLSQTNDKWKEYLASVHADITRMTSSIREERREIYRRKNKGSGSASEDRLFNADMERIRASMFNIMERIRNRPRPLCPRCTEFEESIRLTRKSFGEAYGSVETRTLLDQKRIFEDEMAAAERDIEDNFVRFSMSLLKE